MPRFLYVGNHAGYFLTHRLPVMLALQENGYEVHATIPTEPDALAKMVLGDAVAEIQSLGFPIHSVPLKRGSLGIRGELQVIRSLFRIYKQVKPDIIYHATMKPVIYGGLVARLTNQPAIISAITGLGYTFIGSDFKTRTMRKILSIVFRFVLGHSNSIALFQNDDDRDLFVKHGLVAPEKTLVIKGSGVDVDLFHYTPETPDTPIVVLPSRLLWDKGVGEFVEAARNLRSQDIEARFVLVGDVDPENPRSISSEQLQAWINEGIIEWWGWQQDMSSVFQKAHIVCLPSYREGLPKALIEASAAGRAIATTDVPGCREVVQSGENGLLVPVKSVNSLQEALSTLIENPDLRQMMGKKGREKAEKEFSTKVIVANTLQAVVSLAK